MLTVLFFMLLFALLRSVAALFRSGERSEESPSIVQAHDPAYPAEPFRYSLGGYAFFLRAYATVLLSRLYLHAKPVLPKPQVFLQMIRQLRITMQFGRGLLHG